MRGVALLTLLLAASLGGSHPAGAGKLVSIEPPDGRESADLALLPGLAVYHWGEGWVIAEIEAVRVGALQTAGWHVRVLDENAWTGGRYYLVWAPPGQDFAPLMGHGRLLLEVPALSPHDGRTALVKLWGEPHGAHFLRAFELMRIERKALPPPGVRRGRRASAHERGSLTEGGVVDGIDSLALWLAGQVEEDSLLARLRRLEAFETRYSFSDSAVAASRYLEETFRSFGIDSVYLEHFDDEYGDNVVATLPGSSHQGAHYIICGHYDSISENPLVLAPGADDNGSGTALVLESARVLAQAEHAATIRFICFCGEEQGLVGSNHYANQAFARGDDILGVLTFDMVGYQDDGHFDCYLYSDEASRGLADFVARTAPSFSLVEALDLDRNHTGSDHARFQNVGYEAILLIEAWETAWYPHYHTIYDTVGNLSIPFLAEMTRLSVAAAALLAGEYEGPAPSPDYRPSVTVVPNPYRAGDSWAGWSGMIEFKDLPASSVLSIFTLSGDCVATLEHQGGGGGATQWDPIAADVASGVYLYAVESSSGTIVGKLVIIR